MDLLLGVDVGTSATKAVLSDTSGRIVAAASSDYPTSRPRPGWSEQDPADWWRAVVEAIRAVLAKAGVPGERVRAVGLSGQMHGSVFLPEPALRTGGREAEPLRSAILWNDQRTAEECRLIEEAAGGRKRLVELVGNPALAGFTLTKMLWVRRHEPQIWARTAKMLLPKDYIRLRLTGEVATDVGDAAGVMLLDVRTRRWSDAALRTFDIDPAMLPPIVESAAPTGGITPWAAEQTGLKAGTMVVGGSGDNQTGGVGAGVVRSGMALATLGTSGVIFIHSDRPRLDAESDATAGRIVTRCAATGSAATPGEWCLSGCTLSAGGSLAWCRETIAPGVDFEQITHEASIVPPGSDGLVFLPYLTGERAPHPDPEARGGWIGLTSRHTRGHLVRAVLEGVTFTMAQILDLVRGMGIDPERVRLGGGGARSLLWRQMQADIYGCEVALPNTEEGPAFGAALLAGVGVGVWPGVAAACEATVRETEVLRPDARAQARYAPVREVFDRLYGELASEMAALGRAEVG